jgi:hypothetical protein
MLDIVIPSYGRANNQATLSQLVLAGLNVILVVQEREHLEYSKWLSGSTAIYKLPADITTIAPTRDHIMKHVGSHENVVMVDDDLHFARRRTDDPTKLRDITPRELAGAFDQMTDMLDWDMPHVGFAAREGANRNTGEFMFNTRIMRVLGYNRAAYSRRIKARFDDMDVMEDFHVALALLESGGQNVVLNNYTHNQAGGSAAKGGCSHFRTPELHGWNARRLAELHPGVVKVVQKTTKGAWGGGERTDVNIQWKKAYESSRT